METRKTFAKRHSTRSFQPGQIPENALEAVLDAAGAAPVGMKKYETLRLTVVQNKELIAKISAAAAAIRGVPGQDIFYGAPTVILVSSKPTEVPGLDYSNAACLVENMLLAATDLELGNVYVFGGLAAGLRAEKALLAELGIPEGFFPLDAVALGYPTEPLTAEKNLSDRPIAINRV